VVVHSGDDEVAALLAQAKALREEAERDEAAIKASRTAQEAAEAAEAVEAAAAAADATALKAAAERAQQAAQAAGEDDVVAKAKAELAAAKANLEMAKQEASGVQSQAAASPPKLQGSNPSGRLEDVKMNYSGTVMTQAEWEDLSEKFKDMNLIEQFQTNSKVGPQGRRKLKALREGKTGRAFILPGERVRLLQEETAFRAAFKRFPAQSLNGYSAEKWAKRGQECIIEKTFNDKTITCVFADNSRLDFPWEIVDGYVDD